MNSNQELTTRSGGSTTLEFLNNHTNPLGAWGTTGFTQYGVLPLMFLAYVTGMIGITFHTGWFASIANWVSETVVKVVGFIGVWWPSRHDGLDPGVL